MEEGERWGDVGGVVAVVGQGVCVCGGGGQGARGGGL